MVKLMKKNLLSVFILFFYIFQCGIFENEEIDFLESELISIKTDLTFTYGPSFEPALTDCLNVITLDPYFIGKFELTNEEYYYFIKDGGYDNPNWWSEEGWNIKEEKEWSHPLFWGKGKSTWEKDQYSNHPNTPVHGICFFEAEAYCNWLSEKAGKPYRVPTSAQWQRAAKGPDPGRKYPWGNDWFEGYANYFIIDSSNLSNVDYFPESKSPDGCYNMVGNVDELTIPISIIMGDKNNKSLYSYPNLGYSSKNLLMRSMTTASWMCIQSHERWKGVGIRICVN